MKARAAAMTWPCFLLSLFIAAAAAYISKERAHDENALSENGVTPSSPSFLFLLVDDIGWADFGYNNGTALTPNINVWASAKGSIRLQDFHSGGTVCSPTRATVLTGRHHFRDCVDQAFTNCHDMTSCPVVPSNFEFAPSRTFTVGDAIRAVAGDEYEDGAFFAGKWHLGSFYNDSMAYGGGGNTDHYYKTSSPITHGFHHFNSTVEVAPTATTNCQCHKDWIKTCNFGHYMHANAFCSPNQKHNNCCFNYWWDDPLSPHGVANLSWPTPKDDALYLADSFSRFLESRRNKDEQKPFFAQVSFHNCHVPFIGSKEARDECAKGDKCRPPRLENNEPPYTDEELDYYACLNQLDHAVQLILNDVKRAGYYDNTMIWLASDNGPERNCPPYGICQDSETRPHRPREGPGSAGPLRGRKRDIYEGGHRVAGIVSFPAMVQQAEEESKEDGEGRESWETVVTTDFLPTVMELLGVDRPTEQQAWAFDGRSILPLLRNTTFRWQDTKRGPRSIGFGYADPKLNRINGWGFRYGRWKYVEGSTSCERSECRKAQLYDLDADLGERHDLADEYPDVLADLQRRFQEWHASIVKSRRMESKCQHDKGLPLPRSIEFVTA